MGEDPSAGPFPGDDVSCVSAIRDGLADEACPFETGVLRKDLVGVEGPAVGCWGVVSALLRPERLGAGDDMECERPR